MKIMSQDERVSAVYGQKDDVVVVIMLLEETKDGNDVSLYLSLGLAFSSWSKDANKSWLGRHVIRKVVNNLDKTQKV